MRLQPEVGQQTGVHERVQRLDPAVQALREAGQLLDLGHRQAGLGEGAGGRAGGDDLDPGADQGEAQLDQAGLVVDRHQRALDRTSVVSVVLMLSRLSYWSGSSWSGSYWSQVQRTLRSSTRQVRVASRWVVSTSSRRSATLIRSCRLSTVSSSATATAAWSRIDPGVDAGVDEEHARAGHLHPVRQGVPRAVHAREGRQQRRVGVDHPAAEAVQEDRARAAS